MAPRAKTLREEGREEVTNRQVILGALVIALLLLAALAAFMWLRTFKY